MKIKLFRNSKISTLLISGFAAMVVLMCIIGAAGYLSIYDLNQNLRDVSTKRLDAIDTLMGNDRNLYAALAAQMRLFHVDPQTTEFEQLMEDFKDQIESAEYAFGDFKDIGLKDISADQIAEYEKGFEAWKTASAQIVEFIQENTDESRSRALSMTSGYAGIEFERMRGYLENIIEDNRSRVIEARELAEETYKEGGIALIAVTGIGLITAIILSLTITRIITRPIQILSTGVSRVADGDLGIDLDISARTRELSLLMLGFSAMLDTLRGQVSGLTTGANTISVSTSQISATATELAATASEASISVNEITTTAEEVKQTVRLSSEKATQMADAAEEIVRVADQGRKATEDAVAGMNRVKDEMEYIAESIVKLSEQTQSIGEIIDAVNDLANESNLLSVNASIEAAKAGEFGKGFAVVAQEVKSLSDQSKQATAQVRTILNDIQNATSQAVMATERGAKAVDAGVDLASRSGQSIRALAENIVESSRSSAQIAASSKQQLAGMDQLAQAMSSIQDAALQNVEGSKRLEDATMSLSEIAGTLKKLSDKFSV